MVAVDESRKPVAVPTLVPETEEQKLRWEQALLRKQSRQMVHGSRK
jgi:acyl-CoA hydrolase